MARKYNVAYLNKRGANMGRKSADTGDEQKHKMISGSPDEDACNSACSGENKNSEEDSNEDDENEEESEEAGCKTWLEVLPSKGGLLLAALLTEIMTEGLTPDQMNILGNFISSVGSLISYKASRDDLE